MVSISKLTLGSAFIGIFCLCALFYFGSSSVLENETESHNIFIAGHNVNTPLDFSSVSVYPEKVRPGDVLLLKAEIPFASKIVAEVYHENGFDVVELYKKDTSHIWEGTWVVHNTLDQTWYPVIFIAYDVNRKVVKKATRFKDPTVSHSANQIEAGTFEGNFAFDSTLSVGNAILDVNDSSVTADRLVVKNGASVNTMHIDSTLNVNGRIKGDEFSDGINSVTVSEISNGLAKAHDQNTDTALGTNKVVVDETGKVGIGTDSPDDTLEIESNSNTRISIHNTNEKEDEYVEFSMGTGTINSDSLLGHIRATIVDANPNPLKSSMSFFVNKGDSTLEAMTITSNGNIGIGTNTPVDTKLKVMGTIESRIGGIKFPDGSVQRVAMPARVVGHCTDNMELSGSDHKDITTCGTVTIRTTRENSHLRVSGAIGYINGISTKKWWWPGFKVNGTQYKCAWEYEGENSHALHYNCITQATFAKDEYSVSLTIQPYNNDLSLVIKSQPTSATSWIVEELYSDLGEY